MFMSQGLFTDSSCFIYFVFFDCQECIWLLHICSWILVITVSVFASFFFVTGSDLGLTQTFAAIL